MHFANRRNILQYISCWPGNHTGYRYYCINLVLIFKMQNALDYAQGVLALMECIQFGVSQFYNIVMLGKVEHLIESNKWVNENKCIPSQLGYVCAKDGKADCTGT